MKDGEIADSVGRVIDKPSRIEILRFIARPERNLTLFLP